MVCLVCDLIFLYTSHSLPPHPDQSQDLSFFITDPSQDCDYPAEQMLQTQPSPMEALGTLWLGTSVPTACEFSQQQGQQSIKKHWITWSMTLGGASVFDFFLYLRKVC